MIENEYVIAWSSRLRSSGGKGKKLLSRHEAEQLARELNRDYPQFTHQPVKLNSDASDTAPPSNVIDLKAEFTARSATVASSTFEKDVA
jgi:hypothetical protein